MLVTLAAISAPIALVVFVVPYVTSDTTAARDTYVSENETVLRSLPVFRGAAAVRRRTTPVTTSNVGTGWMTTVTYRVPQEVAPNEIDAFYRARLRGWRISPLRRPAGRPGERARTRFRRGEELVVLRTGGSARARRTYDVSVDHSTDLP